MINIIRIPALNTNYIWILYNYKNECVIIDPGETIKILNILKKFQFILRAILLTHNHIDHVGGVNSLIQNFPQATIYGPVETQVYGTHILVSEGDCFTVLQKKFRVFSLPGHTLGHIGFYSTPWLFCGDTVFPSGCGKIHTGLAKDMYESCSKIKHLPHNTLIFSGHEYTLSNVNFLASILPQNQFILNYRNQIIKLRKKKQPTVPTTVGRELRFNPFFCCNNLDIKRALNLPSSFKEEWQIFSELRKKKDLFRC